MPSNPVVNISESGAFIARASNEQARLWYLWQESPADYSYNMVYKLTLKGALNIHGVSCALTQLQSRHEILRTSFTTRDGLVYQLIHAKGVVDLETFDLSGMAENAREQQAGRLVSDIACQAFDLSALPLMRCRLIRLQSNEFWLVFGMHHIIGDGWSHAVLTRDFCHFYNQEMGDDLGALPVLEMQYADFAEWQNSDAKRLELKKATENWVQRIVSVPPLELAGTPQQAANSPLGLKQFTLTKPYVDALNAVARRSNLTTSAIFLAVYQQTLAHLSAQTEFLMGIVVANRELPELDDLIGFFANTLALAARVPVDIAPMALAEQAQSQLIDVQQYRGVPYSDVVHLLRRDRGSSSSVDINALFVLQNSPFRHVQLRECEVYVEKVRVGNAKFPITLFVTQDDEDILFDIEYATERYASSFMDVFETVFCRSLSAYVDSIQVPSHTEASRLDGVLRDDLLHTTIVERVWQRAGESPVNVALRDERQIWQYRQLVAFAESMSCHLIKKGLVKGDVVVTCLPRSMQLFATIMGILRAGLTWAPIDHQAPVNYRNSIIAACDAKVVFDDDAVVQHILQDPALLQASLPVPAPDDIAILFHTSGSTGVPKGVRTTHKGLANICCWIAEELNITPITQGLWKTTVSFDAVCRELFPILIGGGVLHVAPKDAERDMAILANAIEHLSINVLHCVPSQLRLLLAGHGVGSSLNVVMCGGEALDSGTAARVVDSGCTLYNVYGPTETTVDVTYHKVLCSEGQVIPIGRPVPNATICIVNNGEVVEKGCVGEIFIYGPQVAKGYLNAVANSGFGRLEGVGDGYFTGDYGYISQSGELYYKSRGDRQVKLNGVRIELSAIEHGFLQNAAIKEVHVECLSATEMVAFITPAEITDISKSNVDDQWNAVFALSYGDIDYTTAPQDNALGWNCSATKQPIPADEVLSACQQAANKILRWQPRRILELGCGLGTLSFRLIPHCEHFVGVDFSQSAIDYITHHVQQGEITHADFYACDIRTFEHDTDIRFDAIVINSVVQYFGGEEDLLRLLERICDWLTDDGFVFIGDVRDKRLDEAFHFWKTKYQGETADTAAQTLLNSQLSTLHDRELRLTPEFFYHWAESRGMALPLIEMRTAQGNNELTKFRFDVTLSVVNKAQSGQNPTSVQTFGNLLVEQELDELAAYRNAFNINRDLVSITHNSSHRSRTPFGVSEEQPEMHDHCRRFLVPASSVREFSVIEFASPVARNVIGLVAKAAFAQPKHTVNDNEPSLFWHPAPGPECWRGFLQNRADILEELTELLPRHSMPTNVIQLPQLPLSRNGKRDTKTLRKVAAQMARNGAGEVSQPVPGSVEAKVADTFAEFVGVSFQSDDNFFFKGGHSLLAAQVRNKLQQVFACSLSLDLIFEHPTPKALANAIIEMGAGNGEPASVKRPQNVAIELSHAQKRLWMIESLGTDTAVYNIAHAVKICGYIDTDVLDQCIGILTSRHATLRSTFFDIGGEPGIRLLPHKSVGNIVQWEKGTEQQVLAMLNQEQNTPFDLAKGPLFKFIYAKTGRQHGILCFICHHIISDGWSMMVALREVSELYNAAIEKRQPDLAELSTDYFDLAYGERLALTSGRLDPGIQRWRQILEQAPSRIALPYDFELPKTRRWCGDKVTFPISACLRKKVASYAAGRELTENMVYLSAYALLLSALSGQDDIVIGTVSANRVSVEHEQVFGMMVNPLPIRLRLNRTLSFANFCKAVRDSFVEAFALQEVPFETLLEHLDVDRESNYQVVFQVLFAMQTIESKHFELAGAELERIKLPPIGAMFDLSLEILEVNGHYQGELEYSSELFLSDSAEKLTRQYISLLTSCIATPGSSLAQLSEGGNEGIEAIRTWETGPELMYTPSTVAGLFNDICLQNPDKVALHIDSQDITYRDLKQCVINLSQRLVRASVGRQHCVALVLPRGLHAVVAYLAVHWVGAAPCYIDPGYPPARVQAMLRQVAANQVLTSRKLALPAVANRINVDDVSPEQGEIRNSLTVPRCLPDDLAFIAFTSGTTGIPKQVAVSHRSVCARLAANTQLFGHFTAEDKIAHCYSFNYDGGLLSLFWPLTIGLQIEFIDLAALGDASALTSLIQEKGITVFDSIPAIVETIYHPRFAERISGLKLVITGGDACSTALVKKHFSASKAKIANQYGPCEGVINATTAIYTANAVPGKVTIGTPIPGCQIAIVDEEGKRVSIGIEGEIWVGGHYLAEGYLNDPEATANRFVMTDFGHGPVRYYRSGDRGKWSKDGQIEFLGRADRQIQKNGMRVELDDIESVICAHPNVKHCRVVPGFGSPARLGAFVVPQIDESFMQGVDMLWSEAFDAVYQAETGRSNDFTGWTNTASGEAIPEHEMEYWRQDTLKVLRQQNTERVLEIGAGLGLLALDLCTESTRYVATDVSQQAVNALMRKKGDRSSLEVYWGDWSSALSDFAGQRFSLIVINSVIQYLKSYAELERLLAGLKELLDENGSIFLGDIKNFDCRDAFYADTLAARSRGAVTPERKQQLLIEMAQNDDELYVSPAGIQRIVDRHFGDLLLCMRQKPAPFENELITYRFDAVIGAIPVSAEHHKSMKWTTSLLHALEKAAVPLKDGVKIFSDVPAVIRDDIGALRRTGDLDGLIKYARTSGLNISLSVIQDGNCSVVLTREAKEFFRCIVVDTRTSQRVANLPLFSKAARRLGEALSAYLVTHLPKHMVPSTIRVLQALPIKKGGKVDERLLSSMMENTAISADFLDDENDIRIALVKDIWCRLLDVADVGKNDDFFVLGGHSLLAIRFVAAIKRELNVELAPLTVFEQRTFSNIVQRIFESRRAESSHSEDPDNVLMEAGTVIQDALYLRLNRLSPDQHHITFVIEAGEPISVPQLQVALDRLGSEHPLLYGNAVPGLTSCEVDCVDDHGLFKQRIHCHDGGKPMLFNIIALEHSGRCQSIALKFSPLAFDGRTIEMLWQELLNYYHAPTAVSLFPGRFSEYEQELRIRAAGLYRRLVKHPSFWQSQPFEHLRVTIDTATILQLECAAMELNVTMPAVVLGKYSWVIASLLGLNRFAVDCSVDTRAQLPLEVANAYGPLSMDLPIEFTEQDTPEDYQLHAAEGISQLMKGVSWQAPIPEPSPFGFSYRVRQASAMHQQGQDLSVKAVLKPHWNQVKLSVERTKHTMSFNLYINPNVIERAQAEALLNELVSLSGELI